MHTFLSILVPISSEKVSTRSVSFSPRSISDRNHLRILNDTNDLFEYLKNLSE